MIRPSHPLATWTEPVRAPWPRQPPPRLRPDATLGVLDITEWFGDTSGGIRTYLLEKARYVAARPHLRHVLVVPGEHDAVEDGDGTRRYRLHGPPIPRQRPYRFMLATRSVSQIVRHERPDLIEIGSPFIVPWIVRHATRALDVPLVSFYHTNLPAQLTPRAPLLRALQPFAYRATWRYLKRLDRLFPLTIVASATAARELAMHGIERTTHVPLGVDLSMFHPARRMMAVLTRARLGLPEGPLVGYAGRFAREKQLTVVLDAWAAVERRTGARLVLAGAGPMERALRAHPYGPRVCFVPFQHEREGLADLLAACDVYLSAGPIETFGLSAVEAMACRTPVLSPDSGAVAEHVRASGGGRLYETGVAGSLAEEAIALLSGDLHLLGRRARAYCEREHDWASVFDRLFAVYASLVHS